MSLALGDRRFHEPPETIYFNVLFLFFYFFIGTYVKFHSIVEFPSIAKNNTTLINPIGTIVQSKTLGVCRAIYMSNCKKVYGLMHTTFYISPKRLTLSGGGSCETKLSGLTSTAATSSSQIQSKRTRCCKIPSQVSYIAHSWA